MLSASQRSPAIAPMRSPVSPAACAAIAANASCQVAAMQLAVCAHPGTVEPPPLQPVDREARLVAEPFLVHVLVQARQNAQHFRPARIDADVGADRVQHVDAVGLAQLPRTRDESVRLRGQRADRAEIDDIARQFGASAPSRHRCRPPCSRRARWRRVRARRRLSVDEADAARAMDAARHDGLDQRARDPCPSPRACFRRSANASKP